ncbi:MAG: hypothetical protein ABIH49_00420 [archaeon]
METSAERTGYEEPTKMENPRSKLAKVGRGIVLATAAYFGLFGGTAYANTSAEQEALNYVRRNNIDLSVLARDEKPVDLYSMGGSDTNKVVITDKSLPYINRIDNLIQELNRRRIENWDNGKGGDAFETLEMTAEDVESVINAMDAGYDCSDSNAGPKGRLDHLITGKEARSSHSCIVDYLERQIANLK